jgi:hypothetical protein
MSSRARKLSGRLFERTLRTIFCLGLHLVHGRIIISRSSKSNHLSFYSHVITRLPHDHLVQSISFRCKSCLLLSFDYNSSTIRLFILLFALIIELGIVVRKRKAEARLDFHVPLPLFFIAYRIISCRLRSSVSFVR